MARARMFVSVELVAKLLHLPEGSVCPESCTGVVEIEVEHPTIPEGTDLVMAEYTRSPHCSAPLFSGFKVVG